MNTSIYVVTHKEFVPPSGDEYFPIEVGAALRDVSLGYLTDATGDNISLKNHNYCELTALYWIWKNDLQSDIVGICHYRRFFSKYFFDVSEKHFLRKDKIEKYLQKYDMILPTPFFWIKHNVASGYFEAGQGIEKDLKTTECVVEELYPNYLETYRKVLNSKKASYCNMFITSKENFDEYCKWLFSILFEVEKRTDISGYSVAEARIYGYISEILLNVWTEKKMLKVKHVNVAVDKPLTTKRKPFAYIEKIPVVRCLAKVLLCMDLNSI